MDGELAVQVAALLVVVVAVLVLHELAHVAVARAYGYRVVCLALSPLAVGIVFLDQPLMPYWLLQVSVPLVVTAATTYVGLFVMPISAQATQAVFGGAVQWELGFSLLLAVLTSSGDLASMVMEVRRPLWGRERVVRDVRLLKRIGSVIRFTAFGRSYLAEEFGQSPGEFVRSVSTSHRTGAAEPPRCDGSAIPGLPAVPLHPGAPLRPGTHVHPGAYPAGPARPAAEDASAGS